MPWLDANGLLPGRGAPGRPTGRGAGVFGVSVSDSAAGASGSAGRLRCTGRGRLGGGRDLHLGRGLGRGLDGLGLGLDDLRGGLRGGFLAGAFLAAGFSSAGAAGAEVSATVFSWSPYSFLNLISTGSSIVEEGDLTNSPISFNFSRTNLLSTLYCLASS